MVECVGVGRKISPSSTSSSWPLKALVSPRPTVTDHLDRLVESAAAVPGVVAQRSHLFLKPTSADAKPQATAADPIEAASNLGDLERVPLPEDQNCRAEAQSIRRAGDRRERGEAVKPGGVIRKGKRTIA